MSRYVSSLLPSLPLSTSHSACFPSTSVSSLPVECFPAHTFFSIEVSLAVVDLNTWSSLFSHSVPSSHSASIFPSLFALHLLFVPIASVCLHIYFSLWFGRRSTPSKMSSPIYPLLPPSLFISSGWRSAPFLYQQLSLHPSLCHSSTRPSLGFLPPSQPLLDWSCFVEMIRRREEGSVVTAKVIGSLQLSFVWRALRFILA